MIAVAVEEAGEGIGRIRMRRIPDASADSLRAFVEEAVTPGSLLHTDGLLSYDRLETRGYRHRITFLKGRKASAAELLPRVHRVVSLLKRSVTCVVDPWARKTLKDDLTIRSQRRSICATALRRLC